MSKTKVKLKTEEAERINTVADRLSKTIIAGETLRLALPIARLIHEKIFAEYKKIEEKYGKVT
jgi:hypothetical protein